MSRQKSSKKLGYSGMRVKHALQLFLLLLLFLWLLYQAKHFLDNMASDGRIMGASEGLAGSRGTLKLGRKDLDDGLPTVPDIEKHQKERQSLEVEDKKNEDDDKEERGVGDDGIDENDKDAAEEEEISEDPIDEEDDGIDDDERLNE